MAEAEEREVRVAERPRGGGFWLWVVIAVPVLYVLSVGPVARMHRAGIVPNGVKVIYEPLEWTVDHIPGAEAFFGWYLRMWGAG